eukprot:3024462-Rhodomonas_salina.1
MLAGRRHFAEARGHGEMTFDPRFLMFEFVWNILLRQKQIDIVHKFAPELARGPRQAYERCPLVLTYCALCAARYWPTALPTSCR